MRATFVVSFALFLTSSIVAIHADVNANEDNRLDGYAIFNDLSKEVAAKKAREMAETDFARNQYRVFVAGMRRPSAYDDYLKEKYGIQVTSIAGCVVTDGIMGAIEGYNSTMKPLLNRKFGHDIFKEAEEARK